MPPVLYAAPVVCPMTGPPLADGGVLVDGDRIVEVGERSHLAREATRVHEVEGVLLPGLVDGSTVLEYADAAALAVPGPAHAWLAALHGTTAGWSGDAWTRSARRGVQQLLRAGVTAAGDVVLRGPAVPAASRAGVVGTSWVEVAMVDVDTVDAVLRQVEHALGLPAEGRTVGIAPHAPHTLGTGVLQALAGMAARHDVGLHVRAAETQAEVAALRAGEGPFAALARERGMAFEWLDGGADLSPVRYLDASGALGPRTVVSHGVYVDVLEARLLTARGTTVVCCPRADALRRSGDAPLERYAEAGTRLALGTDSVASSGSADVLAEAATWAALARTRDLAFWPSDSGPVSLEEQAVRLATVEGARAMGWGDRAGVLEPGRRADLVGVAIDTTAAAAYRDLVERGPGRQVMTVLGGVRRARRDDPEVPWPPIDRHELDDPAAP